MSDKIRKTPNRVNDKLKRRYAKIAFLYYNIKFQVSSYLKISDEERLCKITGDILKSCLSIPAFMEHLEINSFKDDKFNLESYLKYSKYYILNNYLAEYKNTKLIGPRPVIKRVENDLDRFRTSKLFNIYVLGMEDEFEDVKEYLIIK